MNDINCNEKLLNIFYLVIREEFEDTKVVIRSRKSKDRQHYDQTKRNKRTNNDLQKTTQKIKDRASRISLKQG